MEQEESEATAPAFVVGIGASAGGLEAIECLLDGLPSDLDMAYVVAKYLSPDYESLMSELLARRTDMLIYQAESGLPLRANSIYLVRPKKEIAISNRTLLLKDKDPREAMTFPIDDFFRSLAQDAGNEAIGIILSGTGSDGSRGICEIHDAGGLVNVQSEETAKFNGMPWSAANSGIADLVLAPGQMKDAVTKYRDIPQVSNLTSTFHPPELNEDGLKRVFTQVRDVYGRYLILGPNEMIGKLDTEFECEEGTWKLFRKSRDVRLTQDSHATLRSPMTRSIPMRPPYVSTATKVDRSWTLPEAKELMLQNIYHQAC